jgi:hypothetical protein
VQADAAGFGPGPRKKLDAVGADAWIALTKFSRQLRVVAAFSGLFGHNQEVVTASMSFRKWNQSSSESLQEMMSGFPARC